jgi:ubiquinone biosynthesis protein COQ4
MALRPRIHPVKAWTALQNLLADPDDTQQAFRTIASLSGNSSARLFRRFRRTRRGSQLLEQRPSLFDALGDIARLERMPEGSLGRAIAHYFANEAISAEGLAAASEAGATRNSDEVSEEERYLMLRLRDQHDIFHVLAGYGRDMRGELAVLAFTAAQTHNPGVAFIPLYVLFKAGRRSEIGQLILQGFRRGLRASWLVNQPWEELLGRSLDELRADFGIGEPPHYAPLRSAAAQAARTDQELVVRA